MTDRLTPGMRADVLELMMAYRDISDGCVIGRVSELREEAARREAEQKPFTPNKGCKTYDRCRRDGFCDDAAHCASLSEGPGSAAAPKRQGPQAWGPYETLEEIAAKHGIDAAPAAALDHWKGSTLDAACKPAPAADDLVAFLRGRYQQHCTLAADRIEAQHAVIERYDSIIRSEGARLDKAEARADRLVAFAQGVTEATARGDFAYVSDLVVALATEGGK